MNFTAIVWDYDIDEKEFLSILEGTTVRGKLDADWAARRVIEFAPFEDIIAVLGYRRLVQNWPRWRRGIRSLSRKRGLDFMMTWLPLNRNDLVEQE